MESLCQPIYILIPIWGALITEDSDQKRFALKQKLELDLTDPDRRRGQSLDEFPPGRATKSLAAHPYPSRSVGSKMKYGRAQRKTVAKK